MKVKRLYVVNDGANNIDMMYVSCLLHPFDYKLVRARCGDHEVDVVMGYHEECIDELEFEVTARMNDLYNVMYDLYGVDGTGKVDMYDMIFVAEADDGEYVEFSIADVRKLMWEEFVEEIEEGI
jgi:hypothetical protein